MKSLALDIPEVSEEQQVVQVPYNHTKTGSRWQVGQNAPEFPEQQGEARQRAPET